MLDPTKGRNDRLTLLWFLTMLHSGEVVDCLTKGEDYHVV